MTDKLLIFNVSDTFTRSDDGYKGSVNVAAFKLSSLSHIVGYENSSGQSIVRLFFSDSTHIDGVSVVTDGSNDRSWEKTYVDIVVDDDQQYEFIYQFSKRVTGDKSPVIRFDEVNSIYGASSISRNSGSVSVTATAAVTSTSLATP
jgi:hypothetical protein